MRWVVPNGEGLEWVGDEGAAYREVQGATNEHAFYVHVKSVCVTCGDKKMAKIMAWMSVDVGVVLGHKHLTDIKTMSGMPGNRTRGNVSVVKETRHSNSNTKPQKQSDTVGSSRDLAPKDARHTVIFLLDERHCAATWPEGEVDVGQGRVP